MASGTTSGSFVEESGAWLAQLMSQLPDAVYLIDPQSSNILYCNQRGLDDLQLQAAEVLDHSVLTLQKDVSGLPAWRDIAEAIRSQPVFTFVGRHRRKDGSEFPVEVNTSAVRFGGVEYFVSVARDITRRRLEEQELLGRDRQLWFALNEASDGLWDWYVDTGEVYFSPQLKRMLGYGPDEMRPHVDTWSSNVHPEDVADVMQSLDDHLHGRSERYEAEYRLRNRNGHYLWVHDKGRIADRDAEGRATRVVGMVRNITDQKTLQHSLARLAAHDELTGLLNRREGDLILEKQLDLANRLGVSLGLCLFDLDHFKQINDRYGHLKGDQVLQKLVELVQCQIRKSDTFYRWGGEEFVLILPDTGEHQLQLMADKISAALREHDWRADPGVEGITASFGMAAFPRHGDTVRDLLEKADAALYRAKSEGRNCCRMAEPASAD